MFRINHLIVLLLYCLLLFVIQFSLYNTVIEFLYDAETFPRMNIMTVAFLAFIGVLSVALGIRRYISISTKDHKERWKLRVMFIIVTPIPIILSSTLL
jgi:uncharacterized membrane protein